MYNYIIVMELQSLNNQTNIPINSEYDVNHFAYSNKDEWDKFKQKNIRDNQLWKSHQYFLPLTSKVVSFMTGCLMSIIITISLMYHLFVHLYIGYSTGGVASYQGLMFFSNYIAVSLAYWIILRQTYKEENDLNCCICKKLPIIGTIRNFLLKRENYILKINENFQTNKNSISYYDLFDKISHFCQSHSSNKNYWLNVHNQFKEVCRMWENIMIFFSFVWIIPTILNIISVSNKLLNNEELKDPLVNSIYGLYGFYNLYGQFIAVFCILPAATLTILGFYQLRLLILSWIQNISQSRISNNPIYTDDKSSKSDYLFIQEFILNHSNLWSKPILSILILCTQVIIVNVILIYKLTGFSSFDKSIICNNNCGFSIAYPFIWLTVSTSIFILILITVSSINEISQNSVNVFKYADKNDFWDENTREEWLNYLETNPLQYSISGIVITSKLVFNTFYPSSIAFGSLIFSSIISPNEEKNNKTE